MVKRSNNSGWRYQMGNNGIKYTKGKAKVSLVPYEAIEAIARVREFGVNKYGDPAAWYDNAKSMDFIEAAMRHIGKHMNAHVLHNMYEIDDESGLDHIDHALCSLAMAVAIRRKEQHEETLVEVPWKE